MWTPFDLIVALGTCLCGGLFLAAALYIGLTATGPGCPGLDPQFLGYCNSEEAPQ